jgi:hypothetical protein
MGERDLGINTKAIEEVSNAFKQVEKDVITCTDFEGRLKRQDVARL